MAKLPVVVSYSHRLADVQSSSPKKRKAQGPQQAAPPPAQPHFNSPPFSHGSSATSTPSGRRRHSRQRSDVSARGLESFGQHSSRRHTESGVSPTIRQQGFDPAPVAANEGTLGGRGGRLHPGSTSERQSQVQPQHYQQERTFAPGLDARRSADESNNSAERERERESSSSSRPLGKRDDARD